MPCLKASFSSSMAETAESLTLHTVTLGECFAWSLTMGACHFRLDAAGALDIEGGVSCSLEPIEIEPNIGCVVKIGPQNHSGVSFANNGSESKRDVTATISVTGLHYRQATAACQGGQGEFENGKLTGILTLRADQLETGTQQGLWVE